MPPKSCFQGNLVFTNSLATSRPLPAPVGVQGGGAQEARAGGGGHAPGGQGGGCAVWELLLVPCTLKVLEVGVEFELCVVSEHLPVELVALDAASGAFQGAFQQVRPAVPALRAVPGMPAVPAVPSMRRLQSLSGGLPAGGC